MPETFIGRQPIYDRRLKVFAYELLYRGSETNAAGQVNGEQATSQVILNTFMDIGLENIVGPHQAFINMTRDFLLMEDPLPFPVDRVVLEILEDVQVDARLVHAVRALARDGYLIALDDFVFDESKRALVEIAHIIKIDLLALDRAALHEHVDMLRGSKVKLLAEKVETQDDFEHCRALGFDYFQGYFFCRPKVIKGQRVPANRLTTLHLLAKLQNPEAQVNELDRIIAHDVTLSYRLLRLVNSAYYALPKQVESIRQAVVYLGSRTIKMWASLLALSNIDDKPGELLTTSLVRARMCELLATAARLPSLDSFFTVGMFSALDAILDTPMDRVLQALPLSEEIRAALLHHEGAPGAALKCVLAYERGDWDAVAFQDLSEQTLKDSYLAAIAWADGIKGELGG